MRLSFSSNAYVRYSVFEAVERIAAAGYEAVELLADVPHLYAPRVAASEVDRLKRSLADSGLAVANINANTAVGFYGKEFWEPLFEPSLAHPDPELRRWRVDYSKRCVDIAQTLDCPFVSVTSGRPVPGTAIDRSMDLLRFSLGELLPYAESRNVRIGIEYEPGLLVENIRELTALMDDMKSSFLGANLDLGHSHVLGEDPDEVIDTLGSRVFHIHIEDIRDRKHYHLIPGRGDMDFRRIVNALRRNGYQGRLTVELYTYPHDPDRAAIEALNFLRPIVSGD